MSSLNQPALRPVCDTETSWQAAHRECRIPIPRLCRRRTAHRNHEQLTDDVQ